MQSMEQQNTTALAGKKIVLGVTGGIAAYKAVEITSRLKKAGAERFFRKAHRSATIRYRCSSSARWQATRRPATGRSCGTSWRQCSVA